VKTRLKETRIRPAPLVVALGMALAWPLFTGLLPAQSTPVAGGSPPSSGGFFPLSQVRRGMTATA